MTALLIAWLALAGIVVLVLHREFKRLDRERRMRELMSPMQQAFRHAQIQFRDALTPTLQNVAEALAEMAPKFEAVGKAMRDAEVRAANQYRKGGTP